MKMHKRPAILLTAEMAEQKLLIQAAINTGNYHGFIQAVKHATTPEQRCMVIEHCTPELIHIPIQGDRSSALQSAIELMFAKLCHDQPVRVLHLLYGEFKRYFYIPTRYHDLDTLWNKGKSVELATGARISENEIGILVTLGLLPESPPANSVLKELYYSTARFMADTVKHELPEMFGTA